MKIVQKIETNDLVEFNNYLLDINLSFKISTIVLGAVSLIISIASVVYEIARTNTVLPLTAVICSILLLLGIFIIFFLKPVLKKLIKKRVIKRNEHIDPICITLNEAGFIWEYEDETKNKTEATPYTWNSIYKAVEKDEHIFMHVNKYIILFIKKDSCENLEEMKNILQEKLTFRYRTK